MKRGNILGLTVFLICGAALTFLAGVSAAILELPPTAILRQVKDTSEQLIRGPWFRDPRWVPRRYEGVGLVIYDKDKSFGGLTVLQGIFDDWPAARVYDADGTLLREWPLKFSSIWQSPSHIIPERNMPNETVDSYHTQGILLEPDGSIIVNFAEKGTVKLGACGDVVWTVDRMTHHSITAGADGSFWIPTKMDPATIEERYMLPGASVEALMDSVNYYGDAALHVGADGRVLEEVPVLEPVLDWLIENQEFHVLDAMEPEDLDPVHLNDIEVVTPALAEKIDVAIAGDLLLSLRNLSALAILSRGSGKIVWMKRGGWLRQHDPDIRPDGVVTLFDNGVGIDFPGRDFVGSRILEFDPEVGLAQTYYPRTKQQEFYSFIMGTHQALPNGGMLVTETMSGRVFEISDTGEIVWSMVFVAGKKSAAIVEEARRYPAAYLDPSVWDCGG